MEQNAQPVEEPVVGGLSAAADQAAGDSTQSSDAGNSDQALSAEADVGASAVDANAKPKLIIRFGREDDKEAVLAIARQQHERTIFSDIPFSDAKFDRMCRDWFDSQRWQCGLVAEAGGTVVGFLHAAAGEYRFGDGAYLTTVHAVAVDIEQAPAWTVVR